MVGVFFAFILIYSLAGWVAYLYIDWLWFKSLNYQQVFRTMLLSGVSLQLMVGVAAFLFLFLNLFFTRRILLRSLIISWNRQEERVITLFPSSRRQSVNSRTIVYLFLLVSLLMAFFLSLGVSGNWVIVQKFLRAVPFGLSDPVFQKDVGFYVFTLAFYKCL
ncbi:MAG: UPF0182 family protein, partial [Desulfotomaculales bacterium]